MSLVDSGPVLEAGKMFSLFPPSSYDLQEKTVLGTAEDLITVNWAGVGVGIFLAILGMLEFEQFHSSKTTRLSRF